MVPLGSIATFHETSGPYRVPRYNLFPAAEVQGAALPGVSTGQAIAAMEEVLRTSLPEGFGYEWTELALQERIAGNTAPSPSAWPWSSSSWCWRRCTRAGCCRWPSC